MIPSINASQTAQFAYQFISTLFNDGEVLWFESEMSPPCAHLLNACSTVYNNIIGTLWNF